MLNLFRRHVSHCNNYGKRTGQKCPRKPPCPIHFEGVDGEGKQRKPQALIDPRTGNGVRDWALACELLRDMEAPTPAIAAKPRKTIQEAVEHFLNLKKSRAKDTYRKNARLLERFTAFMTSRTRKFMDEIRFEDLTDMCSSWTGATRSKLRDVGILASFLKYAARSEFTSRNIGEGLFKTLGWKDDSAAREPFEPDELKAIWRALPLFPDEYGRLGQPIARQTEAFVLLMRYTGLDVSTLLTLPKSAVRGNRVLTYRLKNGSEVWTIIPQWVVDNLQKAPHDSETYFFWSGTGSPHTRASKWFSRLRKLLDLAGLPHRTPHNFRHHFAVEHLLAGTPIEDVARLLGHKDVNVTLRSYAAWVKARQNRLEAHQQRVWNNDPLHQKMTEITSGQVAS